MDTLFEIDGYLVSKENAPYIVAELSGNHQQCIEQAKSLIKAAKNAGANAVKLQTFNVDEITLPVRNKYFEINEGLWAGKYLHEIYKQSYTPREWHKALADYARSLDITIFSTPFDEESVDFLEETIAPPAYKVASFEITHIPLLKKIAQTGKPVILSTGMATEDEIQDAINALKQNGCTQFMLLKCVSSYPADPKDFNLRSLNLMEERFGCNVGLSDHSLSNSVALGSVALGARFIEKHIVLSRSSGAIDEGFSLIPSEFEQLVVQAKELHKGLGKAIIGPTNQEKYQGQLKFRRSIFVSKDIEAGEIFSTQNLKIVRPSFGLAPADLEKVLGKKAKTKLKAGEPLSWDCLE